MRKFHYLLIIFIFLIFSACSKNEIQISEIKDGQIDEQMITAYKEGLQNLEIGDLISASKKFAEAEILYPQSVWAPRSALMAAYCYYLNQNYGDAIIDLKRYLKTYPLHERKNYAYYLLALSYYEQIVDEKKDLGAITDAKKYFQYVINNYPNSEFAVDSIYKLDLIEDFLASKEMYLGRYYLQKEKWIPAINRFKEILINYDNTIYVEEALHRLVEVHYKIGLEEEAKKYASLLGYNYQSSQWYEKSYKIFNQNYKTVNLLKNNKKKKSILDRFKLLIN